MADVGLEDSIVIARKNGSSRAGAGAAGACTDTCADTCAEPCFGADHSIQADPAGRASGCAGCSTYLLYFPDDAPRQQERQGILIPGCRRRGAARRMGKRVRLRNETLKADQIIQGHGR